MLLLLDSSTYPLAPGPDESVLLVVASTPPDDPPPLVDSVCEATEPEDVAVPQDKA